VNRNTSRSVRLDPEIGKIKASIEKIEVGKPTKESVEIETSFCEDRSKFVTYPAKFESRINLVATCMTVKGRENFSLLGHP